MHVVGGEPVAAQARLPLSGHGVLEVIRFLVVEGDRGDAAGPEADVDPGRVPELGGEALVLVARAHGERHQPVVEGLDLGGEHAGRGGRRCRGVGPGLEDAHGEPAQGGGPGAGGADDPAADYGDVNRAHALALA